MTKKRLLAETEFWLFGALQEGLISSVTTVPCRNVVLQFPSEILLLSLPSDVISLSRAFTLMRGLQKFSLQMLLVTKHNKLKSNCFLVALK